jgi:MFS family permease
MRAPRMLEPLGIRDFRLLWTGMTVSLFGDYFFFVALAWETYKLSNTPSALGWVSAAYATPMVLLVLGGGVITDRIERRHAMLFANLLRATSTGTAGALAVTGNLRLWEFAVMAAVNGIGDALFMPAFGSIVPELVPNDLLPQANSLDQFVRPATGLVGPAIAGVVIATSGAGYALIVDASTFVFAAIVVSGLASRPLERRSSNSALRELREGFAFVRARAWLWGTFIANVFMNIVTAARNVLLPFLVKNDLHASARGLGLVYSAVAAGALISAFAFGQVGVPRRHVVVMYLSWAACVFTIALYGVATNVPELVALAFVFGLTIAWGQAIWGTMMHRLVPRELLGRVTSIDYVTAFALMPVSSVAVGFVAAGAGTRATLIGAGILSGTVTVAALALPGMRDSERDGSMVSHPFGEPAGESVQP